MSEEQEQRACELCFVLISPVEHIQYCMCKQTFYCSEDCQVCGEPESEAPAITNHPAGPSRQFSDWEDHEAPCSRHVEELYQGGIIVNPTETKIRQDFADYMRLAKQELNQAVRTPLRVGRPDELHSTSTLQLYSTYDGSKYDIKRQFVLMDGDFVPTSDLMVAEPQFANSPDIVQRAMLQKSVIETHAPFIEGMMVVFYIKYLPDSIHAHGKWSTHLSLH
ncbi:hypothetical protein P7C70_g1170, partial [Phenoliferia sp. Uapishka_3]